MVVGPQEIRSQLRAARLKKSSALSHPSKSQWWQKKRRKEENYWHIEDVGRVGREFVKRPDANAVNQKTPKIMGAEWDQYKHWFPRDNMAYQPR